MVLMMVVLGTLLMTPLEVTFLLRLASAWACIHFLLLFQTLPNGGPDMYVLYCPKVGLDYILILPLGKLWTCMYDCPIVGQDCFMRLPPGRLLDMYV